MQFNLPEGPQMFKLTLSDTIIARGAEGPLNNARHWEKNERPVKQMKIPVKR